MGKVTMSVSSLEQEMIGLDDILLGHEDLTEFFLYKGNILFLVQVFLLYLKS